MTMTTLTLLLITGLFAGVSSYATGPPTSVCTSLSPMTSDANSHASSTNNQDPPPYRITVSSTKYVPGDDITVTIEQTEEDNEFRGFIIQARRKSGDTDTPIGTFKEQSADAQLLECTAADSTWAHSNTNDRTTVSATWTAPSSNEGTLAFRATIVVQNSGGFSIFYENIMSDDLTYNVNCSPSCTNGGVCTNTNTCTCTAGYTGNICQTRPICVETPIVTSESSTELAVTWNPSTDACFAEEFQVTYTLLSDNACPTPADEVLTSTPWQATYRVILDNLRSFSVYNVTVASRMSPDSVGASAWAVGETLTDVPSAPPASVTLSDASDMSVTFEWDNVPCLDSRGEILEYRYRFKPYSMAQTTIDGGTTSRSYKRDGLKCNSEYMFAVAARNNDGVGPYTDDLTVYTMNNSVPFIPESTLKTKVISKDTVEVNWEASDCPASEFNVEVILTSEDQCRQLEGSVKIPVQQVMSQTAEYTDLLAFSSYDVVVSAYTTSGDAVEQKNNFVTSEDKPSESPSDVQLIESTPTTLTYSWETVPCGARKGNIIGYHCELRHPDGTVDALIITEKSKTFTGLLQNREYAFRVAAKTSVGIGVYSNVISTRTDPAVVYECSKSIPNPCSFGYYQNDYSICEVAKIMYLPLAITHVDGVPVTFTLNLNPGDAFSCRVKTVVEDLLKSRLVGFEEADIRGYRGGSIIVDIALVFDKDSTVSASDVNEIIQIAAAANGDLGNDLIVSLPVTAQDKCPPTYCLNGGTCVTSYIDVPSQCSCAAGYKGDHCEIQTTSERDENQTKELEDKAIVTIVVMVIIVLVTITIGCLCGVYNCIIKPKRLQARKPEPTLPVSFDPYTGNPPQTLMQGYNPWSMNLYASNPPQTFRPTYDR